VTAVLDPISADRLAKLLGMLGSDHVGERAAAGAKADELVRRLGLSWFDIVVPKPVQTTVPRPSPDMVWRRMALYADARQEQLTDREAEFIESMLRWRGEPTEKQKNWLMDIYARLSGGG